MQAARVGIRDAKMHLSKYIKLVQQGTEVIITDRGRPVGKIIPIQPRELPLDERIKRLEDLGMIDSAEGKSFKTVPPPIPVTGEIAQKLLQEDRDNG
jgi:prevent-host-death family protein